jgi:hypothetical protein
MMKRIESFICHIAVFVLAGFCNDTFGRVLKTEHFSAWVPDSWRAFEGNDFSSFDKLPTQCKYFKNPKNKYQSMAISLCVVKMNPAEILHRIGFRRINDDIVRVGSMDSQVARIEYRSNYPMISAAATCGITDSAGFHAAKGNCFSAAIFGRDYDVAVETDGTEPLDVVRRVTNSVILHTPAGNKMSRKELETVNLDENQQ